MRPFLDFRRRQPRYVRNGRVSVWATAGDQAKKGFDPRCVRGKRVPDRPTPGWSPTTGDNDNDDDLFEIAKPLFHFDLPILPECLSRHCLYSHTD